MNSNEWALINVYPSEAEARVVESFLSARGFEVQLLDTHSPYRVPAGLDARTGMRLVARESDREEIQRVLLEAEKPTHLEVVGEEVPLRRSPSEYWIPALLILVVIGLWLLNRR